MPLDLLANSDSLGNIENDTQIERASLLFSVN
jgi:hypothetical protein